MATIATLGEAMLRLSVPAGERLQEARSLDLHVGGSEANVAFALAQIGVSSSWTSVLPGNPLGRKVASTLASGASTCRQSSGGTKDGSAFATSNSQAFRGRPRSPTTGLDLRCRSRPLTSSTG